MWDALLGVQRIIADQVKPSGNLYSIKHLDVGPSINPPHFPVVSILPVSELFDAHYTSKLATNKRISIKAHSYHASSRSAIRSSIGIIQQIQDLFEVNGPGFLLPDTNGNPGARFVDIVGLQETEQQLPFNNGYIHTSSVDLLFSSLDTPMAIDPVVSRGSLIDTDTKTMVDSVTTVLKKYNVGQRNLLSSVKSFKDYVLPPAANYPVIFVNLESEQRSHYYTGRDTIERNISINVITKIANKPESLQYNLGLIDYCKNIILANQAFDGKVIEMELDSISYGQVDSQGELLYGSSLSFWVSNTNTLPQK